MEEPMTILESTPQRMVVQAGSLLNQLTLTLDKETGRARLDRSMLMWHRKPVDIPLAEIDHVDVVSIHDAVSGADVHEPVLHTRTGDTIPLPVPDDEADHMVAQLRGFLGIHA
jgi:hypothetical protein